MPSFSRLVFALVFLICSGIAHAEMTVITLQRSNADQLIPAIAAQLGEGSSVTSYQNQIILNANAEETARVKNLIKQLDSQGRQLLISVKTDDNQSSSQNNTDVKITHSQNGSTRTETRVTTRVHSFGQQSQGQGLQSIRATEGMPSLISIGQSKAYNSESGQTWHNADNGFYATARVNNGIVNIAIEQQRAAFTSNDQRNQQQLRTSVSGRTGEWIVIGTLNNTAQQQTYRNGSSDNRRDHANRMIYLKVDLLP